MSQEKIHCSRGRVLALPHKVQHNRFTSTVRQPGAESVNLFTTSTNKDLEGSFSASREKRPRVKPISLSFFSSSHS